MVQCVVQTLSNHPTPYPKFQKAHTATDAFAPMRRRVFLAVSTAVLSSLAGCNDTSSSDPNSNSESSVSEPTVSNQPTQPTESGTSGPETLSTRAEITTSETSSRTTRSKTVSQQAPKGTCSDVSEVSFYALGEIGNKLWRRNTVWVDISLGDSSPIHLVVFEKDNILGMTEIIRPSGSSEAIPIILRSNLSGRHTIRVVAYPAMGEDTRFRPEAATPCQYEGDDVQTEPTTIDFSRFSAGTTSTTRSG